MNCPHCQKPISQLSILTSLGGVRVCPECNKKYVVKYNYTIGAIVAVAGLVLSMLALTFLFYPREPSGALTGLMGVGVLAVAALIAGRPEKHDG
jgi:hypothetical protein